MPLWHDNANNSVEIPCIQVKVSVKAPVTAMAFRLIFLKRN